MDRLGEKLEAYGIQPPSVEVVYQGLNVETDASVGSASIPTLISPIIGLVKVRLQCTRTVC